MIILFLNLYLFQFYYYFNFIYYISIYLIIYTFIRMGNFEEEEEEEEDCDWFDYMEEQVHWTVDDRRKRNEEGYYGECRKHWVETGVLTNRLKNGAVDAEDK